MFPRMVGEDVLQMVGMPVSQQGCVQLPYVPPTNLITALIASTKKGGEKGGCWLLACLTSQQHASVSQGRICSDKFTFCHTVREVADHTFHLTQSQYTDTGPTSPSTDPITPGAWQGRYWSANFKVTGMTRPWKNPVTSGIRTRDLSLSRRMPYPLGQRGSREMKGSSLLSQRARTICVQPDLHCQ